ncbi:MAG: putative quinol monooxygenase [Nibricoccus sp.]
MDDAKFMLILLVNVHVKAEYIETFKKATLANAMASMQEPGCARFDVCQQNDDPSRFVLIEAYHDAAGHAAHRETAHYATWRDTVNAMMASTRTSTKCANLFPEDSAW